MKAKTFLMIFIIFSCQTKCFKSHNVLLGNFILVYLASAESLPNNDTISDEWPSKMFGKLRRYYQMLYGCNL